MAVVTANINSSTRKKVNHSNATERNILTLPQHLLALMVIVNQPRIVEFPSPGVLIISTYILDLQEST